MRRNSFFAAGLVSLTTLLTAGVAMSGPSKAPPLPKANANVQVGGKDGGQIVVKDGKATITVESGAAAAVDSAKSALAAVAPQAADAAKGLAPNPKLDAIDKARRGVVTIERAGEVVGLGSVLANDGRVITALSPLSDGNGLDLRYADGSVVHAKVGHSDRLWDLALLVPQVGRWQEGLSASDADAMKEGAQLRAFAPGKSRAQPASVVLKSKRSLLGADDQMLRDVFEVGTKIGPKEFGSPVVDEAGNVVAVLGRACVPVEKGPCAPTAFGVPVDALRSFLRTVPASAVPPAPWLGIQGVADRMGPAQGVRVVTVSPESPADEAGLKGGQKRADSDLIVAIDDAPVTSPEVLSKLMEDKAVGDRVKMLLFGAGKFREVTAVLTPAPRVK